MWKFGQPQDSLLRRFRSRRFEVSDLFPAQSDGSSPACPSKKRNRDWMRSLGSHNRAIQTIILTSHAGSFELSLCNRVLPARCAQCRSEEHTSELQSQSK